MKPRLYTLGSLYATHRQKKRIVIDVFVILKSGTEVPIIIFFCNDYQIEEGVLPDVQDIIQQTCAGFLKGQMSQLGISFPIILYAAQMIVGKWTMTIFPSPNNLTLVYKSLMRKKRQIVVSLESIWGKRQFKKYFQVIINRFL